CVVWRPEAISKVRNANLASNGVLRTSSGGCGHARSSPCYLSPNFRQLDSKSLVVVGDASFVPAPPVWATGDDRLTAQPPAVIPLVIVVWPPTASEKEAVTYEPVVKVVVLVVEVAAMMELAVVEMAFARSKVALSGTTPTANVA